MKTADRDKGTREIQEVLQDTFGYASFRPYQREIIEQILTGRDVIAIMPTGGGKSLCYQLPARILEGTTVVISPLISLMKDQVDGARETGLRAAYLNSSLDAGQAAEVRRSLAEGQLDLLYIAPERLASQGFPDSLKAAKVSLFAIDEAHCISQWGHDFRPDYRNLSLLRAGFPEVPIAAFTASATSRVQEDIGNCLDLKQAYTVRASFDRPNIYYEVRPRENANRQTLEFLRQMDGASGIVYCATRKEVERVSAFLQENGVSALPYHAGLSAEERSANQEAFNLDKVSVMVATVAFGMGIDKPNIRFVVHVNLPKDMESYYQETGRAGRDGDPAWCLLLRSTADIPLNRRFILTMEDETLRRNASARLQDMIRYGNSLGCRRRQILRYFGEEYPKENCDSCDVCRGTVDVVDITEDGQKVLSAVYRTGQRFGTGHVVDVLTGANTARIRQYGHEKIKTYGVGRDHDKKYWRAVIDELIGQECLRQEGDRYPILGITGGGKELLYGRRELQASRAILERKKPAAAPLKEAVAVDSALLKRLKQYRSELAAERQVPPYVIASDRTLREVCAFMPETEAELKQVHGIGEKKLQDLGPGILRILREYRGE